VLNKVLIIMLAYVIGSIPFTFMMAKIKGKVDLSRVGSGNLGGTNAIRVLGWVPGMIAGLLDIAKGVIALWLTDLLIDGPEQNRLLAAIAVTVGHNWSLFFGGKKGGKGISTTMGSFLYLNPLVTVISIAVALEIVFLSRLVSLGSLVLVTLVPLGLIVSGEDRFTIVVSLVLSVTAFYRHRQNIRRLRAGEERRIGEQV